MSDLVKTQRSHDLDELSRSEMQLNTPYNLQPISGRLDLEKWDMTSEGFKGLSFVDQDLILIRTQITASDLGF